MFDQSFCQKVLRKQKGQNTPKKLQKLSKKGIMVINCAFWRPKT